MDVIVLPKSQAQSVMPPPVTEVLRSEKSMQSPMQIVESVELNAGVGGEQSTTLIKSTRSSMSVPSASVTVNETV